MKHILLLLFVCCTLSVYGQNGRRSATFGFACGPAGIGCEAIYDVSWFVDRGELDSLTDLLFSEDLTEICASTLMVRHLMAQGKLQLDKTTFQRYSTNLQATDSLPLCYGCTCREWTTVRDILNLTAGCNTKRYATYWLHRVSPTTQGMPNYTEFLADSIYDELSNTFFDWKWSKPDSLTIRWDHREKLRVNNKVSGLRGGYLVDSAFIQLRFESNWTQERIDTTKRRNEIIAMPLVFKFNKAMDSLEWRVKFYRDAHLNQRIRDLPYYRLATHITNEELDCLNGLVRIPDYFIDSTGIFIDAFPNTEFLHIYEEEMGPYFKAILQHIGATFDSDIVRTGTPTYVDHVVIE